MTYIYLTLSLLFGVLTARLILAKLFGNLRRFGGAPLLPAIIVGVAVTLLLRLSQHQVGPTIYISTVLLSCGAIGLWILGLTDDYSKLSTSLKCSILTIATLIAPLAGLRINRFYGLCGVDALPFAWSFVLTICLTLWIVQSVQIIKKPGHLTCSILIAILIAILGTQFFVIECYTYAYLAFALLGGLGVILYYKHHGDECIGSNISIGNSGTWVLGFALSYLTLKLLMDNQKVISAGHNTYVIAICILLLVVITILQFFEGKAAESIDEPYHTPIVNGETYEGEPGLVSVIMPTWNSQKFVSESISCILQQTYTNLELIITDDASTDKTPEILRQWAEKDKRVKIILNTENGGAGVSRNCSIRAARGQYIAFCDSDDRWMPEKLETQVRFMQHHKVALCFAPYYTCDAHNHYLGYVSAPRRVSLFQMMCDNKIGFLTAIYDTAMLGKHFMPAQRKRQDHALLLTLLKTCRHAYSVPEPLAHYRLHPGNMSASKMGLLKFNARTYNAVFGWPMLMCWTFLFTFFMPTYFWKRTKNIIINISRTQLG